MKGDALDHSTRSMTTLRIDLGKFPDTDDARQRMERSIFSIQGVEGCCFSCSSRATTAILMINWSCTAPGATRTEVISDIRRLVDREAKLLRTEFCTTVEQQREAAIAGRV